jgi:hypothetical protein
MVIPDAALAAWKAGAASWASAAEEFMAAMNAAVASVLEDANNAATLLGSVTKESASRLPDVVDGYKYVYTFTLTRTRTRTHTHARTHTHTHTGGCSLWSWRAACRGARSSRLSSLPQRRSSSLPPAPAIKP